MSCWSSGNMHDIMFMLWTTASWRHLPMWARASWERTVRVGASRPMADLERGRTGDPLWDAAQRGLLRHGVMHNNVRMTWGKATVRWLVPRGGHADRPSP